MPLHRGYGPAADHQDPVVLPAVLTTYIALQVPDPADVSFLRQVFRASYEPQALALSAEERLRHQPVPERRLGLDDRSRLRQALDRPGRWRRQAGTGQKEAGHRFVDAALDRLRRIDHRHTQQPQRVQHAQAQGNLLERAGGHRPHDHGVGQARATTEPHAWLARHETTGGEGDPGRDGARGQECWFEPCRVPAFASSQKDDVSPAHRTTERAAPAPAARRGSCARS